MGKKVVIGEEFGRLKVLRLLPDRKVFKSGSQRVYECLCECGNTTEVLRTNLSTGNTRSCGCLLRERRTEHLKTHGRTSSPEYQSFKDARKRCNDPKNKDYRYYGGRGIQFRFTSFEEFFIELGERPSPKHTLDRIETNGHYEPGNVRWATRTVQNANRRIYRRKVVLPPLGQ